MHDIGLQLILWYIMKVAILIAVYAICLMVNLGSVDWTWFQGVLQDELFSIMYNFR